MAEEKATTMSQALIIRDARPSEYGSLGRLIVSSYSALEGFPGPAEQPQYYEKLAHIGDFASLPGVRLLVAIRLDGLIGGVVYVGDMAEYGSDGVATQVRSAAGMRLLAVDPKHRGMGAGNALARACIDAARAQGRSEMILHTTVAMQVAWRMYERLGFRRATEFDFLLGRLPILGFRLRLDAAARRSLDPLTPSGALDVRSAANT
jgi:GNAT superfamily N-acetyltransferase